MDRPFYLAGEWISGGAALAVRSPWSGEVVGTTSRPGASEVEHAVREAVKAFAETKRMPAHGKAAILRRIAARINERRVEFEELISREAGKPIRYARGEVARAVQTFTEAAEECSRMYGEILPLDVSPSSEGRLGLTRFFPVGPVLAVTPFNFPLNLVAHKLAPAIAAGCTVLLKPSSEAPLTALLLAEVVDEAGLPHGALSVLPLEGQRAEALATRPEIRAVSFTGSADVGWRLKEKAWDKRVTLELGGNAAVILHEDWDDLEGALDRIVLGGYAYSGQVCISVQRVYVHDGVFGSFAGRFVERVKALRAGDPLDEATEIGPMINEGEAERVERWVAEAVDHGAAVLCGGRREKGFYHPTVITDADPLMRVVCEEVFGPVTILFRYGDFDSALGAVNDSRFGLQAGVFTRDLRLVRRAFDELEVGGVIAGDVPTFRVDRMPYGGVKGSGTGREGLRYATRELCEPRLLVIAP